MTASQHAAGRPIPAPAPVPVAWSHREPPLVPAAGTATGRAARDLALAAAARTDEGEAVLRAAGHRDDGGGLRRLVVLGDPDDLPWCAGARYLGWEAGVLVPTEQRPSVPADVLAAHARSVLDGAPLVIVLPGALVGLSLPVRAVDGPTLRAWIGD